MADVARHESLSQTLQSFVDGLGGEDCTVGELVERIGDRGFGLLFLVLALPAALPVPAPGYATPFGILMVIGGAQIVAGRRSMWLPEGMRKRRVSHKLLAFSVKNGRVPLGVVEFLIRPRMAGLAKNRAFLSAVGVIVVLMACFMTLPVPLTNTAPSFVIFVLAAGMLEEDGLVLLAGVLLAPVAAVIACTALYFGLTLGMDAVEGTVKPMIKGWLGLS